MSPDLAEAVERLYTAFERPRPTKIFGYTSILGYDSLWERPAEEFIALVGAPLREVAGDDAWYYASSALYDVGGNEDLRYFWPRLVELSLPRWTDIEREALFKKPHLANWRQTWTTEEQAATEHFARTLVSELARKGAASVRPVHWDTVDDLGDETNRWVCALEQCFEQVTDYLGPLVDARPATTLLGFYARQRPYIEEGKLMSSYWKRPRQIVEWLRSPEVTAALGETWDEMGPELASSFAKVYGREYGRW